MYDRSDEQRRRRFPLLQANGVDEVQHLVPTLTVGVVAGLIQVTLAISFGALIFAGPLDGYVAQGIGLNLVTAMVVGVVTALLATLPGTIGGNQNVPSAILAVMAAGIAARLSAPGAETELYLTVVAAIGGTTILTGIALYALGRFRLGALVRFLPYPVVGGFLAGTGWLLAVGGMELTTDLPHTIADISGFLAPAQLVRWLPGVLFALVLYLLLQRWRHPLAFPLAVLGAMVLFYAVAFAQGTSLATLSAEHWLLGPFPAGNLWRPLHLSDLANVRWETIPSQIVNMGTLIVLTTVALLLNATALELASGRDVDLDRELRTAGLANLVAGIAGGPAGFQLLSLSTMTDRLNVRSRAAGIIAAAICLLALLLGPTTLALFPKFVFGGLLLYLGFTFLVEWVVATWSTLPRADYLVLVLILGITAFVGFLQAVAVGLVAAVALFVISYSNVDVVHDELSGTCYQSRVTRPPQQREFLWQHGEAFCILRLQGFIFFGTADRLLERIQQRLADPHRARPRFLLLDFRRVTGIDATALLSFSELGQIAHAFPLTLVLSEVDPRFRRQLADTLDGATLTRFFPDLDHGVEWCEHELLREHVTGRPGDEDEGSILLPELERIVGSAAAVAQMLAYFERWEVEAGFCLMRRGEVADDLYFLDSGQVTAQLAREGSEPVRLQTMQGGHVLGEIGFFLGQTRTADVVADTPSIFYRLTTSAWEAMRRDDPHVAATLYQVIVHLLGERVTHLVSAVDVLRR